MLQIYNVHNVQNMYMFCTLFIRKVTKNYIQVVLINIW